MAEEIKKDQLVEELEKMQYDPWLPVESKLVWGCIGLGIILLIVLIWISRYFISSSPS
ncbi:MAG: hypothetical protein ACP5KO_05895 [Caldimicrobium sp.]|jgi:uncharacterized membrane protein YvbJ